MIFRHTRWSHEEVVESWLVVRWLPVECVHVQVVSVGRVEHSVAVASHPPLGSYTGCSLLKNGTNKKEASQLFASI